MNLRHGCAVAGMVLATAGSALGGEFQVHPSLAVSENFTDNVYVTQYGRKCDFITRAMPGITLSYQASALKADLAYLFDYHYYARRSHSNDSTQDIKATGSLTVVDNLLFLDLSDHYQRISLDVTKNTTYESLFENQGDQNVAMVSPYFTLRPTQKTKVKTGYRYIDTRYFNTSGETAVDKTDHVGFLEVAYEFTPKWSATGGFLYTHEESDAGNYDQYQPNLGFRYEYAEKSFLFGEGGYTWIRYNNGQRIEASFWKAGASYQFDTVTATAATGVRYDEDPQSTITQETFVTVGLVKNLHRGDVGISLDYSEYSDSGTDTPQTRKYSGRLYGRHDVTDRLNGKFNFQVENYKQLNPGSSTLRYVAEAGLNYLLMEKLTMALNYTFVDSSSPTVSTDNYYVNRAFLELKLVL